eukprot:TRINITY_DN15686_c1_g1_i1.p1 TRINITY_DN15686_c1_g1~~TRINITY_DN15686_c1_g1_i1.p1  ORF type:complete len:445 (+),score=49.37 TRINITY_DN15686_c1_g1_i1:81-1415(+)
MHSMVFLISVSLLLLWSVSASRQHAISQVTQKDGLDDRISCRPAFQCQGTEPSDTIVKPGTCRCNSAKAQGKEAIVKLPYFFRSRKGTDANCQIQGQSWRSCKFPSTLEFEHIGQGDFFDISIAAPSGHLKGVSDMSPSTQRKVFSAGVRVLSDLDDTLVCSGGRAPAGIDKRCAHGTFYDGAAELFYALSVQKSNYSGWGESVASLPIPFSARPPMRFLRMTACGSVDLHLKQKICNCSGPSACLAGNCNCFGLDIEHAQYGRKRDAADLFGETGQMDNMGATKFKNWMRIRRHLEEPAVFFGDNGQGDLLAAQRMMIVSQDTWREQGNDFSGRVVAAFIHDVAEQCVTAKCRSAWRKHNIFLYSNYCEATNQAEEVGLLLPRWANEVRSRILRCTTTITTMLTTTPTTATTTTTTRTTTTSISATMPTNSTIAATTTARQLK